MTTGLSAHPLGSHSARSDREGHRAGTPGGSLPAAVLGNALGPSEAGGHGDLAAAVAGGGGAAAALSAAHYRKKSALD